MNPEPLAPLRPLMTLGDVSDYLQVPVLTLRRWRSSGIGPDSFKVEGQVRYLRETVESYVADLARKAG